MPATAAPPLTKAAADEMQATAQGAVVQALEQPTQQTRTFVGTLQGAAQTVPGAIGTGSATTAVGLGVGAFTDLNELAPSAYAGMFLYQGIKHWNRVNQDHAKWWLLPLICAVIGFIIVFFMTRGDLWEAGSHCMRSCWMAAYQAMLQYHSSKPLGVFSSAADIADVAPIVVPEGVAA